MAEVTVTAIVNLRVTDSEWRLIMKALAAFAGVNVSPKRDERLQAAVLNKGLLGQRRQDLKDQLEVAERAYIKAEEAPPGNRQDDQAGTSSDS